MEWVILKRSFHFTTLLLSLLMVKQVLSFGSLCSGLKHQLYSAENRVLNNYVQKQKTVLNHVICGRDCSMEEDCKSFNFYEYKKLCELNNATRAEHPQDFLEDQGSVYFDADENTDLLKSFLSLTDHSTTELTTRLISTELTTSLVSTEPTTHPSSTEPTTHPSSTEPTTHHSLTDPTTPLSSTKPTTQRLSRSKHGHETCKQLFTAGYTQSKVYSIYPGGIDSEALQVYCDMETDGGGWTVFQRRLDGTVDFDRTWAEYKSGFGDPSGEYWLGNDYFVILPKQFELKIDLEGWDGLTAFAKYQYSVINTGDNYRLNLGLYSGTAGNSLSRNNGLPFSTRDRDNDAEIHHGAWWFQQCSQDITDISNLNGVYHDGSSNPLDGQGIRWQNFKMESLKTCSMKLREYF